MNGKTASFWPLSRCRCCAIGLLIGIGLFASGWVAAKNPPGGIPESPALTLRQTVLTLLEEGKVEAALEAAQKALSERPKDDAVREEFISLHLSLGRRLVAEEQFALAERALESVVRIDENCHAARALIRTIRDGRRSAPNRVAQAREWIELEWFEPAFVATRQAIALVPERRREWLAAYHAAAIGAGDDDYCTKNFHEAFYYYDAALSLGEELGLVAPVSLIDRWLQSLSHALARDVNRAVYPPEFWKVALRRAAALSGGDSASAPIQAMLRGLAYENMGDAARAVPQYARSIGEAPPAGADLRALRERAVTSLRRRYDVALCARRNGIWKRFSKGDWQIVANGRFRIHHRNEEAGRRVMAAAKFHFQRIADSLALDADETKWAVPCDIYLHANANTFREATGSSSATRAVSVIQARGRKLNRHEVHLFQDDAMLLSASLAHELAHIVLAAAIEYRSMPGALSEGFALQMEPKCRHRQFFRLFRELLRPRPLGALLSISSTHPPEGDFYAEAFRLSDVLRGRAGLHTFSKATGKNLDAAELARRFGFDSAPALEREYLGRRVDAPNRETP